ncbi:electron transport complex subunit RsxC [Halorhodospira neutriphila]|uniref:Ion-translocating oxidoreductase complex subunit C n=1 Tax=Halorhodospira neutriphila TaxID=168379 RepID=A0ABS1E6D5_9GAMM|nr:electron transport complex subunit RsxC [Halorhodospira neutriphila]MBK1726523.1 electron transport complex subunit RsxC [Halorhodospira neutriphila]
MELLSLLRGRTFRRGVEAPEYKELTAGQPIRRLPFAPRLVLPLDQHFGDPARALVRKGQEVVRGEPVAEAQGPRSVPIHAPVTGVVEDVELMPTARGPKSRAVILRTAPGDSQAVRWSRPCDPERLGTAELIEAVQRTGLVGQGGAAFPTHLKLSIPDGHAVDTLVVNGCECEPYLTTDHRIMLEQPALVLAGVRLAMQTVGAERTLIGVEDNKPDAIAALRGQIGADEPITVRAVKSKYPQGSEKMLIKTLLGREVPSGGLPFHVGVVVNNAGTLAQLGHLLPRGEGLIERVVTVSGPGVDRPGNYRVPIGTPLRAILEAVGYREDDPSRIILGGPMMGNTVASLDVPITKGVSGLLVMPQAAEEVVASSQPCIRCGRCLEACPVGLNPAELGRLAANRQYQAMEERFNLNDCFECGCCSYVCPSNIPLVQYFRIAKALNRERKS